MSRSSAAPSKRRDPLRRDREVILEVVALAVAHLRVEASPAAASSSSSNSAVIAAAASCPMWIARSASTAALERRRVAALRQEQRLAPGAAIRENPGMIEVDVDHRLIAVEADQERPAPRQGGDVTGGPALAVEEQVLVAVEAEDRQRLQDAAFLPAEQDRIVPLRVLEFGQEQRDLIDRVAERARRAPPRS